MKRTLLSSIPEGIPSEFTSLIGSADIYDSSCSPEARVYFIDKDGGYYLKRNGAGTLKNEADMNAYFHSKGLGPEVLGYVSEDADWLLTRRVQGEDCTHSLYLSDPKRLCDLMAEKLRELHELDASGCPVQNRIESYLALADENYRAGRYDTSYFTDIYGEATADEIYSVLTERKTLLKNEVLLHGDYCLPNIMLDNWSFSGFIDLGNGGIGDRHIDLFWGAWTLNFNLKTAAYRERFFDAYGRDKINADALKVIAAAEVFG